MDLGDWSRGAAMTIRKVAALIRSPHYDTWRSEVEAVFTEIDSAIESRLHQWHRLTLCLLPAGLPVARTRLWPDFHESARWLRLDGRFGDSAGEFLQTLADRSLPEGMEPLEGNWLLEYGDRHLSIEELHGWQTLSWKGLETVRRKFNSRLNVIRKNLRAADETTAELQRMNIGPMLGERFPAPLLREFVRDLLLSGNGALVFGNSFVQWGASETLRRVQPQALIACFGIRNRPKPFSSIVMFEDQARANPVPDTPDPVGSLIDAEMLATYVHLAAYRLAPYRDRTLSIMAVDEMTTSDCAK